MRQAALKRYGRECQACGYVPPNGATRALDVHHLNPLAEGERITTCKDVTLLCANCHRIAHTEPSSIPLDRLLKLVTPAPRAG